MLIKISSWINVLEKKQTATTVDTQWHIQHESPEEYAYSWESVFTIYMSLHGCNRPIGCHEYSVIL